MKITIREKRILLKWAEEDKMSLRRMAIRAGKNLNCFEFNCFEFADWARIQ